MNLVFINSHPIQYFAPLYQALARDKEINLKVIYLSDETVEGYKDAQFGVNVKWDVPLLKDYQFIFLKNQSWNPSLKHGFCGSWMGIFLQCVRRLCCVLLRTSSLLTG